MRIRDESVSDTDTSRSDERFAAKVCKLQSEDSFSARHQPLITNMKTAILIAGILANTLTVAAYLPQIIHLIKTKNSTGQSMNAWFTWLASDIFLIIYGMGIKDFIVIGLAALYTIFNIISLYYIHKFKPRKA